MKSLSEDGWSNSKRASGRRIQESQVTLMAVGARRRAAGLTGTFTTLKSKKKIPVRGSCVEKKCLVGVRGERSDWLKT